MKKILIITYYWPPLGGSGVQRWLKFVKYLPQFGWKPYVFTPENPAYGVKDESLLNDIPPEAEIIRFPIWEPYGAASKFSGVFGGGKDALNTKGFVPVNKNTSEKIISWIRGNIFIPDTRVFWVRPSVRFLDNYLKKNKIHTIATTGPPHSMHLIGKGLKQKNPNLRWIADFRDPWSQWGFLDSVMAGRFARKIHEKLESEVLKTADELIIVTPFYQRQLEKLSGRNINLITNGFDEADFKEIEIKKTEKFIIRHVGYVTDKLDPRPFFAVMEKLLAENKTLSEVVQLDFVGEVHPLIRKYIRDSGLLSEITSFTLTVPRNQLNSIYGRSALLLLILCGYKDAEGYLTGKIFEYLATGLPVLGVGPENGDAGKLLKKSGVGKMFNARDIDGMRQFILDKYLYWQHSSSPKIEKADVQEFSRRNLTRKLVDILEK